MFSYFRETDDSTTVNFSAYGKFLPGQECPGQDVILLAFDHAKLSIVVVDEKERNLRTVSLHSFENEYLQDGYNRYFPDPIVRVDQANRCASMLVYGKHIAVFPFYDTKKISSFIIPLKQIDTRLENIVDFVFLDGYYETTMLFLYEPLQTTAGRAAIRIDSMNIMGVSVNLLEQQFAVVWQVGSLPFDCYMLLPIPKPIGGAVVLGNNEIIYFNQAVPPCGIAVNSCFDNFTKFPLKDEKKMVLTLDSACMEWMEDGRIAVGTKDGDIYLLRLITTSNAAGVKNLELSKVFENSIAYTLTSCAPGHLFVGSRLGDSQLLEYTLVKSARDGVASKRAKLNGEELENQENEEDFEIYGASILDQQNDEDEAFIETLKFSELDRLTNVGPIKSMCIGQATNLCIDLAEKKRKDAVFDIVTASGHGTNGSLCVLQKTIRPDIITSSLLDGAQKMWAVGRKEDESHKYLVVTRQRTTLVLELGEEMLELEEPLFVSREPTVAAGELLQGDLVVQVASMCIALVADGQQLQEVQIDSNFPVASASIVDPYVALLTQNGRLILYELATTPHVHLKEVNISDTPLANIHDSALTSVSVFSDASGLLKCSSAEVQDVKGEETVATKPSDDDVLLYGDEEDMLLYGGTTASTSKSVQETDTSRKRKRMGHTAVQSSRGGEQSDALDPSKSFGNLTYWLVLTHENGRLAIHSLPDMKVVYQVRKFGQANELLVDTSADEEEKDRRAKAALAATAQEQTTAELIRPDERVTEAQIIGMGINQAHPILMAVIDEQVVMYELYPLDNIIPDHLCVSFRRLPHTICLRATPFIASDGTRAPVETSDDANSFLHPFERIGSLSNGVMIVGPTPTFVIYGAWGGLQTHPFILDGPIRAFTSFNNENVNYGFVYLTENESELTIAKLPPDFNYELPFPCKKVPLGKTVHHVSYLMKTDTYAVVTSTPRKSNKIWVVMNDDKVEETHPKNEDYALPTTYDYSLNLYSPQNWEEVPNTDLKFQEMESVTVCEDVALKSESTMSGLENYLALGTVHNYGEEVMVRGRIILCEVIEVVPEPGQPTSNRKIKVLYQKDQKLPVTGLCSMNGLLLTGMGQKVFIWMYKDGDLQGLSFLDMHYYINQMVSIRSIALACDVEDSISLIRFQQEFKALSVASRDDRRCSRPPLCTQFLVGGTQLGVLMSDDEGNILHFNYAPEHPDAAGGERLVLRSAINIGTNVNAFLRIQGHTSLLRQDSEVKLSEFMQQQTTVFGSLDGSFGFIRPIQEKTFRRLHFLQSFIGGVAQQAAGLHPKGARAARPVQPTVNGQNHRNMIDGDIVEQFLHLSTSDKQDLARRLGASRYHILDDIHQLQRLSVFY